MNAVVLLKLQAKNGLWVTSGGGGGEGHPPPPPIQHRLALERKKQGSRGTRLMESKGATPVAA